VATWRTARRSESEELRARQAYEALQAANRRLASAQLEAEAAIRSREEVLAIVSHDLKNPLAAIQLSSELLQRAHDPEITARTVARIRDAVSQMRDLIRNLLDFAQIQAGALPVEPVLERLDHALGPAIEIARAQAEAKHQRLDVDFPADLPPAWFDTARLSHLRKRTDRHRHGHRARNRRSPWASSWRTEDASEPDASPEGGRRFGSRSPCAPGGPRPLNGCRLRRPASLPSATS